MSSGLKSRSALITGLVLLLVIAGVVTGLAVSSGSNTPHTGTTLPAGETITTTVPKYLASQTVRSEVTFVPGSCLYKSGAWHFDGTVKNPENYARKYEIVVDFASQKGDTVQDTKVVTFANLAAQATSKWTVSGAKGDADLFCVIRFALAQRAS